MFRKARARQAEDFTEQNDESYASARRGGGKTPKNGLARVLRLRENGVPDASQAPHSSSYIYGRRNCALGGPLRSVGVAADARKAILVAVLGAGAL